MTPIKAKINLYITEPCSDWFKNRWVELDPNKYTYFTLQSREMIWELWAYLPKEYYNGQETYESFPLAPEFDTKTLIGQIDIREIIGNNYRKPEQLLINNKTI